jgi:hypothetical protein
MCGLGGGREPMELETKFFRLRTEVALGSRFDDWVVADLGAGEGTFSQLLARRAKKVIAVDNGRLPRTELESFDGGKGISRSSPLSPTAIWRGCYRARKFSVICRRMPNYEGRSARLSVLGVPGLQSCVGGRDDVFWRLGPASSWRFGHWRFIPAGDAEPNELLWLRHQGRSGRG